MEDRCLYTSGRISTHLKNAPRINTLPLLYLIFPLWLFFICKIPLLLFHFYVWINIFTLKLCTPLAVLLLICSYLPSRITIFAALYVYNCLFLYICSSPLEYIRLLVLYILTSLVCIIHFLVSKNIRLLIWIQPPCILPYVYLAVIIRLQKERITFTPLDITTLNSGLCIYPSTPHTKRPCLQF